MYCVELQNMVPLGLLFQGSGKFFGKQDYVLALESLFSSYPCFVLVLLASVISAYLYQQSNVSRHANQLMYVDVAT